MARPSYGPRSKQRASRLLEGLLAYAVDALSDCDHLRHHIQIHWRTEQQLVVRTKVRYLEELTAKDAYGGKLTGPQIKEGLKRFEDFLEILEDNRPSTQGSDVWHFTLHLWHGRQERTANLHRFEQEWERRRPAKSKQVTREHTQGALSEQGISGNLSRPNGRGRQDWGEALDVSIFYGRESEMDTLTQWVVEDRCKLITLLGMGGMGKTTLSVKLAEQIQEEFEFLAWRSLRNAPPAEEILTELIHFLSNYQEMELPATLEGKIAHLLDYLRQHRCLLLLDNVESILQGGAQSGHFQAGYEGYGHLLRCVEEGRHQSCVICTSREKPRGIAFREGVTLPIRSMQLKGLSQIEGQGIFEARGCFGGDYQDWREIFEHFAGNPLALKIVASTVQELFEGNVAELMPYLRQKVLGFEDIRDLLQQQFGRLSAIEQQVMYWLAVNRDPISLTDLAADVVSGAVSRRLPEVLKSLGRRSLVERNKGQWLLQPVVMEFVTDRFVKQICDEFRDWESGIRGCELFNSHALIKAQSKDYVRQAQIRLILRPVIDAVIAALGSSQRVEQQLKQMLASLRRESPLKPGYMAGNILNLLRELMADLRQLDCSYLAIWQANLLDINLHQVNFAHCDLSKSVFTDTLSANLSVAFSPDGDRFATGNADGDVRVWQADNCKKVLICRGHASWVAAIAFSPDGQTLASGSFDQTVKLWDLSTGKCLMVLEGHTDWIWSVAFSPDGQMLASSGNDQTIKLWDVLTGRCIRTLEGHAKWVCSVAFSRNGQVLASGSDDHTVKLWDIHTGQLLQNLQGHTGMVKSVAFDPTGQALISGGRDGVIRLWDVTTGQCLKTFGGNLPSLIMSVAYTSRAGSSQKSMTNGFESTTDHLLASGSQSGIVRVWEVSTGDCVKTLKGHSSTVWSVDFHPNGQTLLSGSHDSTVKVWNAQTGQSLRTLRGYSAGVRAIAFSPDGQLLASGSDDKKVRLWEMQADCHLYTLGEHISGVWSVAFSPDGQTLASTGVDAIRLWDMPTRQVRKTLRGHASIVWVAFSPDGQTLASGSADETIQFWDVQSGRSLKTISNNTGKIWSVAFSPDGQILASGSEDATVKLWNAQSGDCITTFQGHASLVFSVAFSPDGKILASGSSDQTIRIWDLQSGLCRRILTCSGRLWSVRFSPDGRMLACGSDNQTIQLWDIQSGKSLNVLRGHVGEVWSVAFNHHNGALVSGGQDGTVKLWDVQTGKCINTLRDKRPYEKMNITAVTGLTDVQKETLKTLGAVEDVID